MAWKTVSQFWIVTKETTTSYNPQKEITAIETGTIIDQETQRVNLIEELEGWKPPQL